MKQPSTPVASLHDSNLDQQQAALHRFTAGVSLDAVKLRHQAESYLTKQRPMSRGP